VSHSTRFKPGTSGNPRGRPRGDVELAQRIRAATSDGQEIVDEIMKLARNRRISPRVRLTAWLALLERVHGKAPLEVILPLPADDSPRLHYDRLSDTQASILQALLAVACDAPPTDEDGASLLAHLEMIPPFDYAHGKRVWPHNIRFPEPPPGTPVEWLPTAGDTPSPAPLQLTSPDDEESGHERD
jgi:hypothetical protein